MTDVFVRPYRASDESDWLRCRVLAFLNTSYFDDVFTSKPKYHSRSIELVAFCDGHLVGVLDVTFDGDAATIETIAVLPEASRSGTGKALLEEAIRQLPPRIAMLDAWTREDEAANGWYTKQGFTERFRYLHVFATDELESNAAVTVRRRGLMPVSGFFHAHQEDEDELRKEFRRAHVCRQYARDLR